MDHDTLGYKCTLIHSHFYRGYTGLSYNRVSHRYTVGILCYMRIHWDTNGSSYTGLQNGYLGVYIQSVFFL